MQPKNNLDFEFMRRTASVYFNQGPGSAHLILWITAVLIIILLIWANFAELDEITRGTGKVISSQDIQVIQNLEGGILKELFVTEGQIVEKNQILMLIDDTQFASSFRESEVKRGTLETKIARLTAEVLSQPLEFPPNIQKQYPEFIKSEQALYTQRQNELEIQIKIINDQISGKSQAIRESEAQKSKITTSLEFVQKELDLTIPLVAQGAVSEVELLRLKRTVNDLSGELSIIKETLPRLTSELSAEKQKLDQVRVEFQIKSQAELNSAKAELAGLSESSQALEDRVNRTTVRSPLRGTVNQILVQTIGGILKPGQDIIEIVPLEDRLLIEAEIRPSDIGFLRSGLEAMVKLTAYDFSIYGGLKGKVIKISPETVLNDKKENVYLVTIQTDKNYLEKNNKKLDIIPGMRATVDILTGKKTVLDYLLKPILKTKQQALTER